MQSPQEVPSSRSSHRSRDHRPSVSIAAVLPMIEERGSRSRASSAYMPSHTRQPTTSPSSTQRPSHRLRVESHVQPYSGEAQPKWSPIASPLRGRDEMLSSGIASFQEMLPNYGSKQYVTANLTIMKTYQSSGDVKEKRQRKESSAGNGKRLHV